ncbi:MAG: hypothetical protein H8E27_02780 [Verrucomicrobia subdivision 3 bacterium]|nr:hypothetical protein [Limisphaerales bacterium]
MTKEEFIARVHTYVVEDMAKQYREMYASTMPKGNQDPQMRRAFALYQSLNEEQRAVLLEIMGTVSVDALSTIFAVIDGSTYFGDTGEEFELKANPGNHIISGDLSDLLWAHIEDRSA